MKKYFKPIIVLLILVISVASAQWFASMYVRTRIVLQSGANLQALDSNSLYLWGSSYVDFGDSSMIKAGATLAKVDSFTTKMTLAGTDSGCTQALDTVTWLGARSGDVVLVSKMRRAVANTPDTGAYAYEAWIVANDTVIVSRTIKAAGSSLQSGSVFGLAVLSKQ